MAKKHGITRKQCTVAPTLNVVEALALRTGVYRRDDGSKLEALYTVYLEHRDTLLEKFGADCWAERRYQAILAGRPVREIGCALNSTCTDGSKF